jgi:FixJ family two-component response regulator
LGVEDFITKPFSDAILLNRVKNCLLLAEFKREKEQQGEKRGGATSNGSI